MNAEVVIDKAIDEVRPADFDALLLSGGYSPDHERHCAYWAPESRIQCNFLPKPIVLSVNFNS
ncbi:MAG: ral stress protein [Proteobacteria bacterium]|nr:ral stress protein [Pseudomonadota bacterium]